MFSRFLKIAVAAAFLLGTVAVPTYTHAEMLQKEETKKDTKKKAAKKEKSEKKELTPQQQKMKDCGAEWQAMKKDGRAKGTTWNTFRKGCLTKKT